jgi:hypothetical protein
MGVITKFINDIAYYINDIDKNIDDIVYYMNDITLYFENSL